MKVYMLKIEEFYKTQPTYCPGDDCYSLRFEWYYDTLEFLKERLSTLKTIFPEFEESKKDIPFDISNTEFIDDNKKESNKKYYISPKIEKESDDPTFTYEYRDHYFLVSVKRIDVLTKEESNV